MEPQIQTFPHDPQNVYEEPYLSDPEIAEILATESEDDTEGEPWISEPGCIFDPLCEAE